MVWKWVNDHRTKRIRKKEEKEEKKQGRSIMRWVDQVMWNLKQGRQNKRMKKQEGREEIYVVTSNTII